jgi:hypothetical protein
MPIKSKRISAKRERLLFGKMGNLPIDLHRMNQGIGGEK